MIDFGAPSRITLTGTVAPGLVATTISTSARSLPTARPLNSVTTSPGSRPAFAAGPFGATVDTTAPLAVLQAHRLGLRRADRRALDRHADHAARDLAGPQLRQQLAHDVDRHGEPDAEVRGAIAQDRGVDADHFTAQVEQRSARIARVDRRVGLQHVDAALRGDRELAAERADHADRDGMVEAERIADGHHPVAGLHLFRVAEAGFRQRAAGLFGQLDQGAVGQRVAAHHLRVELGAVVFTKISTVILVAFSTTWLFVRMKPALSTMKPVPAP